MKYCIEPFDHTLLSCLVIRVKPDKSQSANCSVTLQALTVLYPLRDHIEVIWPTQETWRDAHSAENLFHDYFKPRDSFKAKRMRFVPRFDRHGFYEELHFKRLNAYIDNYFNPSPLVQNRIHQFFENTRFTPTERLVFAIEALTRCLRSPLSHRHGM